MPEFKLYYFNTRGRAEATRLCFAAAGVKYEDIRFSQEEWQQKKKEGFSPMGYLPVLEVDGKKLCESMTILRYVARELGLAPTDSWEIAQCDMIIDMGNDLIGKIVKFMFEKDEGKKKEYLGEFCNTILPAFLSNLTTLLRNNNGGQGFFVSNKLSYADIGAFQICGIEMVQKALDKYPELKAHYNHVGEIPGIKTWIENRPKTAM